MCLGKKIAKAMEISTLTNNIHVVKILKIAFYFKFHPTIEFAAIALIKFVSFFTVLLSKHVLLPKNCK